jgi:hypothetical protein
MMETPELEVYILETPSMVRGTCNAATQPLKRELRAKKTVFCRRETLLSKKLLSMAGAS